ncbi:site-specific DNA-methyltransferase [Novosphingobium arvoryzae]|uniref:site-specific DNA-methyltransferase (adenine-specific) n=1 Tax=Novosphingobium arvoryzae TaxID=1256514 RepID=A0A918VF80_9SPHN|nr:site-specific DNA-methyltransferase [Novosphingobium arvoryzae]GGZ93421.1 site-specific DNA-methyltransferase [Novosphingobium arvoryzae]
MTKKTKLELTWPGKDERPKLEPRILIENPDKSYHAKVRREGDIFDNMLIKGDNLLALKALEQDFSGKVKCVFIDPPYNTGSAFEHYDDGLEHSIWLSFMRDRLDILKRLLSDDGSLWITIDDNEAHYLKVMCDEIFGRSNFVANVVWQKTLTRRNDARLLSNAHDHVLIYAKNADIAVFNRVANDEKQRATYTNRDNDPRGDWLAVPIHAPNLRANLEYEIITPGGRVLTPPSGRHWATTKEKFEELVRDNRIYFGRDGNGMPQRKKFWAENEQGLVGWTWWSYQDAGENREANKEAKELSSLASIDNVFSTPKPEKLLKRIIETATLPGDIVLDSFSGSGTTGAVAHKMGRRWIMVEIGEHADTHVLPRLQKVIDGTDQGGISKAVDWKGGGGFRYFTLAPSLLSQDKYGNWVIAKDYNPAMLAEAMCKHMGFTYAPSSDPQEYWLHGSSTETDFIYVTTQSLTYDACAKISHDVGPDRSLLICCKAYDEGADAFENLTMVKIPTSILQKCEWGRDDYSLNIQNLPMAEDEAPEEAPSTDGLPLFGGENANG